MENPLRFRVYVTNEHDLYEPREAPQVLKNLDDIDFTWYPTIASFVEYIQSDRHEDGNINAKSGIAVWHRGEQIVEYYRFNTMYLEEMENSSRDIHEFEHLVRLRNLRLFSKDYMEPYFKILTYKVGNEPQIMAGTSIFRKYQNIYETFNDFHKEMQRDIAEKTHKDITVVAVYINKDNNMFHAQFSFDENSIYRYVNKTDFEDFSNNLNKIESEIRGTKLNEAINKNKKTPNIKNYCKTHRTINNMLKIIDQNVTPKTENVNKELSNAIDDFLKDDTKETEKSKEQELKQRFDDVYEMPEQSKDYNKNKYNSDYGVILDGLFYKNIMTKKQIKKDKKIHNRTKYDALLRNITYIFEGQIATIYHPETILNLPFKAKRIQAITIHYFENKSFKDLSVLKNVITKNEMAGKTKEEIHAMVLSIIEQENIRILSAEEIFKLIRNSNEIR